MCSKCAPPPAVPVSFRLKLKSQEAVEEGSVSLRCELSKAGVAVEWRRNAKLLREGRRYELRAEGRLAELVVRRVVLEDAGEYSCSAGDAVTSADLTVRGRGPSGGVQYRLVGFSTVWWWLVQSCGVQYSLVGFSTVCWGLVQSVVV